MFHPKTAEYIFISSAHGTFSRIDHMLGHKVSFNKFKKIEVIPRIFYDCNSMKLEINHKKKHGRHINTWRLNNMLLNNEWVSQEIEVEVKKYMETNENEIVQIFEM